MNEIDGDKMARGPGRPQLTPVEGEGTALAVWLIKNMDRLTDLTDDQLAKKLGYTRPNIISMWRTGRTRIPLEKLRPISEILGVEFLTLLPLWLEQYMERGDFKYVVKAAERLVSENEAEFLTKVRAMTKGRPFKLRKGSEKQLLALLDFE